MHTDPETLALLALGETVGTPDERAHVHACPTCSAEVADLSRLTQLGRSTNSGDAVIAPGPQVWHRIAAELGLSEGAPETPAARPGSGAVVDLRARRRPSPARRYLALALAAAVALVAGVGLGLGWNRLTGGDGETVASARLEPPTPQWSGASGDAQLQVDDGRRYLVVNYTNPHPVAAPPQVWVRGAGARDIINLGPIFESGQRFRVDTVNLDHFSVVDISDEPDSDPAHSGVTILQGKLTP